MAETVTIPKDEYNALKQKASFADDVLLQLGASLNDSEAGKVKPAEH